MFFDKSKNSANTVDEIKESRTKKSTSSKKLLLIVIGLIVLLILAFAYIFSLHNSKENKKTALVENTNAVTQTQSGYEAPPPLTQQNTIVDKEALKRAREEKEKQELKEVNATNIRNTTEKEIVKEKQVNSAIITSDKSLDTEQITYEVKNAIKEAFNELEKTKQRQKVETNTGAKSEDKMKEFLLKEKDKFVLKDNLLVYQGKNFYIGDKVGGYKIIDITDNFIIFYDEIENWNYKLNF